MNEPPQIPPMAPLPRNQRNIDEDNLNLLSVFHFVGAVFALLGILFLFVHYALMHFMFTNPALWENQKGGPPPAAVFGIFLIFYVIAGAWLVISGILNVMSGLFLRERKNWTFSFVVACVNCIHVPLGTVLGVFTIVVLSRESVKRLYGGTAQA
jgi:hypothetical protein